MKYISTRGDAHAARAAFCEILLEGLAPDGGLYLPQSYPQVDAATLARWRGLSYAELAFEILSLYIDDIPPADLRALVERTYTAQIFGDAQHHAAEAAGARACTCRRCPTARRWPSRTWRCSCWASCSNTSWRAPGGSSTSWARPRATPAAPPNTRCAASRACACSCSSPHGRMSPFQQAQMFSLQDPNIHNIAIEGVFDDCQDIVKAVSNDLAFKQRHHIGTVNSINWARLLAQVVYYFAGWFQATRSDGEVVDFAVPSGNFGNICAGHVARSMGLPIGRLVAATNENDVLDEFFRTGRYRVRGGSETFETSSPSMDISKASNFERFVFDLVGRDARAHRRAVRRRHLARRRLPDHAPTNSRASPASASAPARACMPIAWPPSATPGSASAR